jgi:MFS family permease
VFFPALSQEFGWSRSQAAHGVSLAMLGFTLMQPLTGKLMTWYGAKRVILGSAALFGLGLVSIALLVVGRWSFYACTIISGAVSGGTSPLPHGTLIARWFTRRRGLAMGIVAAGVAAGGMVLPPLVSHVITVHGWRVGFVVLGILTWCVTLPVVSLVTRNTPEEVGLSPDGRTLIPQPLHSPSPVPSGYTAMEARHSHTF